MRDACSLCAENNRRVIFQKHIRIGKVFVLAQGKEQINASLSLLYSHRFLVFPIVQQSSGEGRCAASELRRSVSSNETIISAQTLRDPSGSILSC